MNVLIADDHPSSQAFLEKFVRSKGHTPIVCSTGAEAISRHEEHHCKIWMLDWMMPGLDGIETIRMIRRENTDKPVYIIMLTARSTQEDLSLALDAGADDFIAKPIGPLELRSRFAAAVRSIKYNEELLEKIERINSLNTRLERMAHTDDLTGLLNRRAAMNRLSECWAHALRYDEPLTLAIVDIDRFKSINDTFGHAQGDVSIQHVAMKLQRLAREYDIVSRIGGEEFMIVLPRTNITGAYEYMERCRASIQSSRWMIDGKQLTLTVSGGIAGKDADTHSPQDLIKQADELLYEAKKRGRNKIYTPDTLPTLSPEELNDINPGSSRYSSSPQ